MRRLHKPIAALALVFLLGCGGAFGRALKQGDRFMAAGQWDQAAEQYEKAVDLRPGDPKASAKLRQARIKQAHARVVEAKGMLAKNDAEGALTLLQEAVAFDPDNADAPKLLDEATTRVLDRAEALLGSKELDDAFRLTTLALNGKPDDSRAKALDSRARDGLAERSYQAASKLEQAGKLGAALAELGAATEYVPGYQDAETRFANLKAELKKRIVYHAVIGRFFGDVKSRSIAAELTSSALDDAFGDNSLVEVSRTSPLPGKGFVGLRLGGQVSGYSYDHARVPSTQTCSYVCGTSVQTNANHTELKSNLARSRTALDTARRDVTRLEGKLTQAERRYEGVARDVDRAQLEVDRARLDLERCQQNHPGDPCDPERRRLEQELTRLGAAQARAEGPATAVDEARQALADATSRRDTEQATVDSYDAALSETPSTVEVQKTCQHDYVVTAHDVTAKVEVTLRAEALRDHRVVINDQTTTFRESDRDQSFPAVPGRCAEVSQGDPLQIKPQRELDELLAAQARAHLVKEIRAQYDNYRRGFLEKARRQGSAGVVDEAVDAYVRFLLTSSDAAEGEEARKFIQEHKKISAATVQRLL